MKKTILIADDDKDAVKYLKQLLESMDYKALTARNGDEAFDLFQRHSPPVALIDIHMPGINGIELLKKIKARERNTEVIMTTGFSDIELAIESLKNEANDFVIKPIGINALEVALKRAAERIVMRKNFKELKNLNENFMEALREKDASLPSETDWIGSAGRLIKGAFSVFENVARDGERQDSMVSETPFFLSIHDKHLKIIEASVISGERLGVRVGGRSWEIYDGEAGEEKGCPARLTFEKGVGIRQKAVIKKTGAPVIVHTAPIRDSRGNVKLVVESHVEISKTDQIQKRLRAIRHRYQILFDEAPCCISLQNRDLEIVAANKRFVENFGDDIVGSKCHQVYRRENSPCDKCPVVMTFEDGNPRSMEKTAISKNGEERHMLVHTNPVKDESGNIIQVMEMSVNITEIKKLQDRMASIGFLIGSISHGMKNLLTSLDGGMYIVNSAFSKDDMEGVREGWEDIKIVVNRIKSMVMDILHYIKERPIETQRVDALDFAHDVADTFQMRLKKTRIRFLRDFDESPGDFEIDTEILHTALVNILENAFQACAEAKSKKELFISFKMRRKGVNIIFEIKDNGVGMDRETIRDIFRLFVSSKGKRGTGLGLFVANRMIRQHGGTIEVDSTPGKGSRFHITAPDSPPPDASGSSSPFSL
ncbi:Histidine kinase [Candidatus Desulfarcum epimagneticum]|uniref:histidine kinase n=1 Tax=uncultured Desulfobacteraceae bacterium TaxID=218296 RepID=A0A484HG31_9BACT|nr:Histidine kinase [uncultured Desulfobacteraceae bacterium]